MNESHWSDGYLSGIGRAEFFGVLEPLLSPEELFLVETAYNLSKYGHRGQERDDGVRYFEHPKAAAWILIERLRIVDAHMIALALLHDIQEDSYIVTWELIRRIFGIVFVRDLKLLTKDKEHKEEYIERLREFGSTRALFVKLADRVHNLMTLFSCSDEKRRKQVLETREFYFPLATVLEHKLPFDKRWRVRYLREEMERYCMENDV